MNRGTTGEREMQSRLGSQSRARDFYERQMHDRLSPKMSSLIQRQEMMFLATSDSSGNCDCTPRFGLPGFVQVFDEKTLGYAEIRGNGVFASLGNITENPHAGLVFVDFFDTTVGLHINGTAKIYTPEELSSNLKFSINPSEVSNQSKIECWVIISIDEAYIHCSKHVPRLAKSNKDILWGTDDPSAKSTDFFRSDLP